jgi:co-chaperonin GroES (HSP10)
VKTNLHAPPGKLLVIQRVPETESKGGIATPERAQTRVPVGTVVLMGGALKVPLDTDGEYSAPLLLQAGDTVYWSSCAGEDLDHEGTVFRVLDYEDVLAWAPAQKGDNGDGPGSDQSLQAPED